MRLRSLLNRILRLGVRLLTRPHVERREHIPLSGPLILAVNHTHALDTIVVAGVLPRVAQFFSKAENLHLPIIGPLIRLYGVIPVERGEADLAAIRRAIEVLRQDGALIIAPEGTRSHTGGLLPAKDGVAFIAARTYAPIVPTAVTGIETFEQYFRRGRKTPVRVTFGPPFRFRTDGRPPDRQTLRRMTEQLMGQIARLLPPDRRGAYAEIPPFDPELIAFLEEPPQWAVSSPM